MSSQLKSNISSAVRDAMRARDRARVAALRLINAEIKQVEIDERTELDDERVVEVLARMVKQRRDSAAQFEDAGRTDLVDQENLEISVINEFMPKQLGSEEIEAVIGKVVSELGASSMRDMGRVMGALKSQLLGRADMASVSTMVRQRLGSGA